VRMRYMQAKETGVTRSSIPLRTRRDMLARLQLRLTWFWLPTAAISIWLWFYRDPVTAVLTQCFAAAFVLGSVLFDHMLLNAWAKNPPPGMVETTADQLPAEATDDSK